ncbi:MULTISPECIES: hypothetical protein [Pseudomonas]|uniref:Lysozyme inhibitor LprI N-terminal domain-containing protein n=1 Tax=Pseudomonas capeferrum TaxID=1495066 RepID=A0ABY7RAV7_9PSED|nr:MULTISPECIES: hypothetical protein [Pseudomonas]MUT52697.1 hypothetical protein [Pseudomonas sp. TDA1]WCI00703.1 hypothetical protein PMC74_02020 [Pseudomonas capeferrum]
MLSDPFEIYSPQFSINNGGIMKVLPTIALLLAAGAAMADAKSDGSARTKIIQDGIKTCNAKGLKTVGEKDSCVKEYSDKANNLYPARGTAYAQRHYTGLSKEAAESTLRSLQAEWKTAQRGGYFSAQRTPGVVTRKAVAEEGWWIQTHILGARQSQDDPWFIECKNSPKSFGVINRCPLGKGGAQ